MDPSLPKLPPQRTSFFNTRNILVLAGASLLILIVVVLMFTNSSRNVLKVTKPFGSNFNFASQSDDKTIRYFTGSGFAAYDLEAHKSTGLTPVFALPTNVVQVLWSKNHALIQATGYSDADQLYSELVKQRLSPNDYYWWLVDLKTGSISLVGNPVQGADVTGAVWHGEDRFAYTEATSPDAKQHNVVSRPVSGDPVILTTLPIDSALVGGNTGTIFYTQPGSKEADLMALNTNSKQTSKITDNVGAVLAGDTTGSLLLVTNSAAHNDKEGEHHEHIVQGNLKLYADGKFKTITKDFAGNATWYGTGKWVATGVTANGTPVGYTDDHKHGYTLTTPDSTDKHFIPVGQTTQGLVLTNQTGQPVYAASKDVANLPSPSDPKQLQAGLIDAAYYLSYDPATGQYSVYILQNPYQGNIQKVQARLRQLGHDPFQLKIKWLADAEVNPGYRLPANAPAPIEAPIIIDPVGEDIGD